jgi:hypothetical protein
MIANFFKYLVIGIAALFALKLAIGLVGFVFGLAMVAIPFALVGYVAYRLLGGKSKSQQISDADRKWLES